MDYQYFEAEAQMNLVRKSLTTERSRLDNGGSGRQIEESSLKKSNLG